MRKLYFLTGDVNSGVLVEEKEAKRVFNEAKEAIISKVNRDETLELAVVEDNRVVYNLVSKTDGKVMADGGIAMISIEMLEEFPLEVGTTFFANNVCVDSCDSVAFKTKEKAEKFAFMSFAANVAMIERPEFSTSSYTQSVKDLDNDKVYYLPHTGKYTIVGNDFVLRTHLDS